MIAYLYVAIFCVRRVKGIAYKVAASLIFILIPTADVIASRIYFIHLCNNYSGQFIYKIVEVSKEYLLNSGEINKHRRGDGPGGYAIAKGGEINQEKLRERYDFPLSKKEDYPSIFRIAKRTRTIRDKQTGEILSESISFLYYGGWVVNIYPTSPPLYCDESQRPGGRYIHSSLFDRTFVKGR